MYLALAGNIGVGKSTLTGILAERYRLHPVFEAVDENPYLEDFYLDMPRYAFHSQIFFLTKRLRQHLTEVNANERVIQDRTIYEDAAIFARNLFEEGVMEARDYRSYCQLYQAIAAALRPPDLLIYLRAEVATLRARIAERGRGYEVSISTDYLARLNDLYERWIEGYDLSERLVIESDETDFSDPADLAHLLDLLGRHGLTVPP
ncbi:MAG: deoxynucleoside kinase [Truepera sp.]|nr:deoxynucleoside kinase [Truepera sp.]